MVSTATAILLVIFVPKVVNITNISFPNQSITAFQVYLMTVWGAGREVGPTICFLILTGNTMHIVQY